MALLDRFRRTGKGQLPTGPGNYPKSFSQTPQRKLNLVGRYGEGTGIYGRKSASVARAARSSYPVLATPAGVQAVTLLSEAVSSLPASIVNSNGRKQVTPEWMLRPGGKKFPEIDFARVVKHIVVSLLLDGTAYVGLRKNSDGMLFGLMMIDGTSVEEVFSQEGDRAFRVANSSWADVFGGAQTIWQEEIAGVGLTVPVEEMLIWAGGVTLPSAITGVSPFDMIIDSLGAAVAMQQFTHKHFAEFAHRTTMMFVREAVVGAGEEDLDEFKENFAEQLSGEDRAYPQALLTQNSPAGEMEIMQVGDKPSDVSTVDLQQHAQAQIALASNTPLALLGGQVGGSSYNSLQLQKAHWLQTVVVPLAKTVAKGFDRALSSGHRLEFDTSDIATGDFQTMAQASMNPLRLGAFTINDVRRLLGMEPLKDPAADEIMVDGNRVRLADAIKAGKERAASSPDSSPSSPAPSGRPSGS